MQLAITKTHRICEMLLKITYIGKALSTDFIYFSSSSLFVQKLYLKISSNDFGFLLSLLINRTLVTLTCIILYYPKSDSCIFHDAIAIQHPRCNSQSQSKIWCTLRRYHKIPGAEKLNCVYRLVSSKCRQPRLWKGTQAQLRATYRITF